MDGRVFPRGDRQVHAEREGVAHETDDVPPQSPPVRPALNGDPLTIHTVDGDTNSHPQLVPAAVTEKKLSTELQDWSENASTYERRGWLLLDARDRQVDVAFIAQLPLGGPLTIPAIVACIRLDYANYDLWPPSVVFIDPRTREPARPIVRAPYAGEHGVRDALVDLHPATKLPFLCLPGTREYHTHPQHSGDDWLLHRAAGEGRLAVICERIWQRMVLNVVGVRTIVQALPPYMPTQLDVAIAQGDLTVMPSPAMREPA